MSDDPGRDPGPARPPASSRGRPFRRRIDRVFAPDLLEGLTERPTEEVRALRDDCRAEEDQLSYTRRLLQARLDMARAEMQRRADGADGNGGRSLIELLPGILADEPGARRTRGTERNAPLWDPGQIPGGGGRRAGDALLHDATLGRLPVMDDEELVALVDRLAAEERSVSVARRRVLDRLDALQTELIRRIQVGGVDVGAIVSAAVASADSATGPDRPAPPR